MSQAVRVPAHNAILAKEINAHVQEQHVVMEKVVMIQRQAHKKQAQLRVRRAQH